MFDLDLAISEWRRQMSADGIKSREVLDELESHLREDVERRMRAGATAEQAFREAVVQVGTAEQLRPEFRKVSKPQARLSRRAVRLGCASMAVFVLLTQGWYLMDSDISLVERIAGLVLVMAIACFIGSLPYLNQLRPGVPGLALRRAAGKTCSVVVPLWIGVLYLNLANLTHFPSGFLLSTMCWTLFMAAAITGVVLALGTDPEVLNLWSPEVWRSFDTAHAEAVRFHHNFIGTEHLLLGLLQTEGSSIPKILGRMGVGCETVRAEIEKIVGSGGQSSAGQKLAYTPRAGRAFQIAIQEAKAVNSPRAGAEHLFLGLIREGHGVAALVLNGLGVQAGKAREEILKELANRKDTNE
jgi:hypothetical protein